MPLNSLGVYQLPAPAYPAVPDTTIESTPYNEILADIAEALNLAFFRDGRALATDDLNMGGNKLTNLANAVSDTDATTLQQVEALVAGGAGIPLPIAIGASVAANALTITLPATQINFRKATATDGGFDSVSNASTLSLVIPSGATLGADNSTPTRILVLAINNSGVTELAVVNNLSSQSYDETGVISTTAIGTASDSANVVYSANARTNVPYRVVGFVDSTQTTAGVYAASPTRVSGVVGQALKDATGMTLVGTASLSGTSTTFTGIPGWATKVTIGFADLNCDAPVVIGVRDYTGLMSHLGVAVMEGTGSFVEAVAAGLQTEENIFITEDSTRHGVITITQSDSFKTSYQVVGSFIDVAETRYNRMYGVARGSGPMTGFTITTAAGLESLSGAIVVYAE